MNLFSFRILFVFVRGYDIVYLLEIGFERLFAEIVVGDPRVLFVGFSHSFNIRRFLLYLAGIGLKITSMEYCF